MNIKLELILLHLDISTSTCGCLLEDNNFISRPLLTSKVESELRDILLEYIETRVDWVRFTLFDVQADGEDIVLIYCSIIPFMLKNKKGDWINVGEIENEHIKKTAFQASQKTAI
jgi:hypothetical protein